MAFIIVIAAIILILGVSTMRNLASFAIKALLIGAILFGGLILLNKAGFFRHESPGQKLDRYMDDYDYEYRRNR